MEKSKKLLLLTSGGDAPGMNAAIRSVVRSSIYSDLEVFACHDGYQGLVEQNIFPMDQESVANCIQRGGTIIRSNRSPSFLKQETRAKCCDFLREKGIGFLVAIGGDGTFRGAALFEQEGGPKVIGIPGTIDNDIVGTDYTIGYDTARNTALSAIDKIRDTASSSNFYFLVETMGRRAGFLAADVGLAGGVEYILTPEFPIDIPTLAEAISSPKRIKKSLLIVVAEADQPGRSVGIAQQLKQLTPQFEYRVCVLGHTQRGGAPSALDRITASHMGNMAVTALLSGKSRCMTSVQSGKYVLADFPDPSKKSRCLVNDDLIKLSGILAT